MKNIALWRAEYETGFSKVDQQHRHLFEIVNRLHEAMSVGHGREIIQEVLDEMIHYTVEHFATEETLMQEQDYPLYTPHKQVHDQLTSEVKEIAEKFASGENLVTVELSHFLTQWLIHHIKGEDLKMIRFFRNQKVVSPPVSPTEYLKRGNAQVQQGQLEQAIENYQQAICLQPNYTEAYYNRGFTYYKQGDFEKAINDLSQAILLQPDCTEAYKNRAKVYYKQGHPEKAINDLSQAILLQPDCTEAYKNRAKVYYKQGNIEKAIADLEKAANFLQQKGKIEESQQALQLVNQLH
jgi:hemerythrin